MSSAARVLRSRRLQLACYCVCCSMMSLRVADLSRCREARVCRIAACASFQRHCVLSLMSGAPLARFLELNSRVVLLISLFLVCICLWVQIVFVLFWTAYIQISQVRVVIWIVDSELIFCIGLSLLFVIEKGVAPLKQVYCE